MLRNLAKETEIFEEYPHYFSEMQCWPKVLGAACLMIVLWVVIIYLPWHSCKKELQAIFGLGWYSVQVYAGLVGLVWVIKVAGLCALQYISRHTISAESSVSAYHLQVSIILSHCKGVMWYETTEFKLEPFLSMHCPQRCCAHIQRPELRQNPDQSMNTWAKGILTQNNTWHLEQILNPLPTYCI